MFDKIKEHSYEKHEQRWAEDCREKQVKTVTGRRERYGLLFLE